MVGCIEGDNLFYSYVKKVDGSTLIEMEDFADLVGGARVMLGLVAKYQLDGKPGVAQATIAAGTGLPRYRHLQGGLRLLIRWTYGWSGLATSAPVEERSGTIGTSLYAAKDW